LFKRRSDVVVHKANMKKLSSLIAILIGISSLGAMGPAYAANGSVWGQASGRGLLPGPMGQNGRMSLMQVASNLVPLGQVLDAINAQEPGSQLDTNTVIENGRTIYVVRWQASRGRIIIFRVDAETGQIIGRQG
jgi:uncharacterized membrane protein YkoI